MSPAAGRARPRRWIIGLVLAGLLAAGSPLWAQPALLPALSAFELTGQRTRVHEHPPGTMPLVAPGQEARTITRSGPCLMCTTGRRGMSHWGSRIGAATPLHMLDREAHALLPPAGAPRRIQLVALEPMVVLVRYAPAEAAPEGGFQPIEGAFPIHGGAARIWYGPSLPGPLAGLSWATPGVPPGPVAATDGRAVLPLGRGRLVLTETAGRITVARE